MPDTPTQKTEESPAGDNQNCAQKADDMENKPQTPSLKETTCQPPQENKITPRTGYGTGQSFSAYCAESPASDFRGSPTETVTAHKLSANNLAGTASFDKSSSGDRPSGHTAGYNTSGQAGVTPPPCPPCWLSLAIASQPWRKRHPILFWGGILLLLGLLGNGIYEVCTPKPTGAWTNTWTGELDSPKLAVVRVDGVILDAKNILNWIEAIHTDEAVKGVLIQVNSPGGAVSPSQEIYFALKRLAATRPVVVSMGALAASGGYYISLPAQHIVATPSTITGSIGVKMEIPNAEGLFQMLGYTSTTLASGDLKSAGSPFRPLSEREQEYFLNVVMDMFEDFIDAVTTHRKLDRDAVKIISDGRALTGKQAQKLGLIDSLGDTQDALHTLGKLTDIEPKKALIVYGPERKLSWVESLFESAVRIALEQKTTSQHPIFMY